MNLYTTFLFSYMSDSLVQLSVEQHWGPPSDTAEVCIDLYNTHKERGTTLHLESGTLLISLQR